MINTQHTLEYFNELESNFINNYITAADNNENYIERILLTPNEEINEQFFKNKVVYTPGSCVIDTTLNFNAEFITGIFKFPNELFRYSKLFNEFADWDKHDPLSVQLVFDMIYQIFFMFFKVSFARFSSPYPVFVFGFLLPLENNE